MKNNKKMTPIKMKNIRTGENYMAYKEEAPTVIDGVKFTSVYVFGQKKLIRTDSLKKILDKPHMRA